MEIICVDDVFPSDQLEHYKKYGVVTPTQDKIYSIREIINNMMGGKGLRLNEIINPDIPLTHPMLGPILVEPNWAVRRFATLMGEPLTEDMLREVQKEVNTPVIHKIETERLDGAA